MQEVVSVELSNIGTHKHTVFSFKKGKCISISGENCDDGEFTDANGSGKSTLLEPLHICFTGASASGRSLKECVTYGESHGYLATYLSDGKNTCKIQVDIYSSKSTKVSIWENDVFRADLHDLKATESFKYIQDQVLGLSKQDLLDFFLIKSDSKSTFLSSTTAQQNKVISRFSEADEIDAWIDNTKTVLKDLTSEKYKIEKEIVGNDSKIELMHDRIAQLNEKLDKVDDNSEAITKGESFISSKEELLEGLYTQKDKLSPAIDELEVNLATLNANLQDGQKLRYEHTKKMDNLTLDKIRAKNALKDHHVCPRCSTTFNSKKIIDLNEVNGFIKLKEAEIETQKLAIQAFDSGISDLNKKISEIKSKLDLHKSNLSNLEKNIRETNSLINDAKARLNNLKSTDSIRGSIREDILNLEGMITSGEKLSQELNEQLNKVDSDIALYEYWKKEYSLFKNYLNQNTIKLIESKINEVLRRISNYEITISDTKQLKSGKEKSELSITIDGKNYSNFSGGERGRIDMASFIAFRDLINAKSHQGLAFLSIDEALDKVDKSGIYNITKNLDYLGVTSAIISQVQNVNENSIVVKKEGGESRIL